MIRCSFSAWDIDSRMEPVIRIGVVLPTDKMSAIPFRIPARDYRVSLDSKSEQPFAAAAAKAVAEDMYVTLLSDAGVVGPARVITLQPEQEVPIIQGAGIRLQGVIAGRGFHWQKRISPTFSGSLEFRAHNGHLIVINRLPLEDYLAGVIAAEMSGACPIEFLKSQCIVARSWVLARTEKKHAELPVDRCNDDCCQRYQGTTEITESIIEAVRSTCGQVLVDSEKQLIDANYSKSCGGISESPEHVWSISKTGQRAALDAPVNSQARRFFPLTEGSLEEYLTGKWVNDTDIFCSPNVVPEKDLPRYLNTVDEGGGFFRWQFDYNREDLEQILTRKFFTRQDPSQVSPLHTLVDLRVWRRGHSGRATDLEVEYLDPMGVPHCATIRTEYAIRDALHETFLPSSAIQIRAHRNSSGLLMRISLIGAGWGHGAGLCQIGALGMALKEYDCNSIVRHYFEGIEIHQCY